MLDLKTLKGGIKTKSRITTQDLRRALLKTSMLPDLSFIFLGSPVGNQDLDSMVLVGPFQLGRVCDSMIYFSTSSQGCTIQNNNKNNKQQQQQKLDQFPLDDHNKNKIQMVDEKVYVGENSIKEEKMLQMQVIS